MIALDTNIILHLLVRSQKEHERARQWLTGVKAPLATTGTNIAEGLRLLTHPRVFPSPLTLADAVGLLENFLNEFQVLTLEEKEDWWLDLRELLRAIPTLRGNEVFDARIALCLRYNGIKKLCTMDANFQKYPFLEIVRI